VTGTVGVDVRGAIGWLTISNPARHNALSTTMMTLLDDGLRGLDADPAVRVIVLRGEGTAAFAAGADISEFDVQQNSSAARQRADEIVARLSSCLQSLATPLVAMIQGNCLGAGMAIALGADIRICSEDSKFAIPAARLGIGYPVALTRSLVFSAGPGHAAEILFTGRRFSAREALTAGFVNQVVAPESLEARIVELTEMIAANSPLSVKAAKAAINAAQAPERLEAAEALALACVDSADATEGQRAFMEKRRPQFQGF
jgi:enoyl-CoA hydratase/carnithine racemase